MERVGVLIDKLKEQLSQKADVHNMLATAQLLHIELLEQTNKVNGSNTRKVSVIVPNAITVFPATPSGMVEEHETYKPIPKPESEPAPIIEPMPEPDAPVPEPTPIPGPGPEPEPIPHFVEQPWYSVFPEKEDVNTPWSIDPVLEVPTLAHQEKIVYELNDVMVEDAPASINDRLKQTNTEMGSMLQESPIRDLKKAVGINDRQRFIQELFRGDETMYERSVKTINSFNIFAEAEYWIQRELKVKLGWDTTLELVKTFDQLVKRRFS